MYALLMAAGLLAAAPDPVDASASAASERWIPFTANPAYEIRGKEDASGVFRYTASRPRVRNFGVNLSPRTSLSPRESVMGTDPEAARLILHKPPGESPPGKPVTGIGAAVLAPLLEAAAAVGQTSTARRACTNSDCTVADCDGNRCDRDRRRPRPRPPEDLIPAVEGFVFRPVHLAWTLLGFLFLIIVVAIFVAVVLGIVHLFRRNQPPNPGPRP